MFKLVSVACVVGIYSVFASFFFIKCCFIYHLMIVYSFGCCKHVTDWWLNLSVVPHPLGGCGTRSTPFATTQLDASVFSLTPSLYPKRGYVVGGTTAKLTIKLRLHCRS